MSAVPFVSTTKDHVREILREHNRHVKEDDLREKAVATAVSRIGNPATKEDTVDTLASMLAEEVTLDEARSVLLRELRKKYGRLPPSTKKQCSRLVQAYARAPSFPEPKSEE